jgi:hypothetical protein
MQNGFFFLVNGSYHPIRHRMLKPGEYCLYSIVRGHPGFSMPGAVDARERRRPLSTFEFGKIKKNFACRCGVCGSPENERNYKNKTLITKLEMGHCNPRLALGHDNCIPMCQFCNRVYKDRFVFNKRGIVQGFAPPYGASSAEKTC